MCSLKLGLLEYLALTIFPRVLLSLYSVLSAWLLQGYSRRPE